MLVTLQNGMAGVKEGVLTMLYKISEDLPHQLSTETSPGSPESKPINALLPAIAALLGRGQEVEVRLQALRTFNMLAALMPEWLQSHLSDFVAALLELARREEDPRLLKVCCNRQPFSCSGLHAKRFLRFYLSHVVPLPLFRGRIAPLSWAATRECY
jgi:hypothetical protein